MSYFGNKTITRMAYLVSHPIQYQAPLLKTLAHDESVDLTVIFRSNMSTGQFFDKEFGVSIAWDTPLLDGYKYVFLKTLGKSNLFNFFLPINYGLLKVLFDKKIDILWIHGWGSLFQIYAILLARALGIRVLIRGESNLNTTQSQGLRGGVKKIFLRSLFRLVSGFLAIGTLNKDYFKSLGVKSEKIFMVPYVVDNKFFQDLSSLNHDQKRKMKQELDIDFSRKIILFASKMIPRKRAIDLLKAYFLLNDQYESFNMPYLFFIGDGESRDELEALANNHPTSMLIKFLGFKNQTELPKYFGLSDVFVLPSEGEPWGLIVNEAMNASLPIIVSDQVGCGPDLVKHGINGFIYPVGDHQKLASYLNLILTQPYGAEHFGKNSFNIIEEWGYKEAVLGINKAIDDFCRRKNEV